jgi:tetratricopeptide (TPR) repeat protein
MLTEDGVKILDFGLAKFAEAGWKLTLEGSTIGTIAYMSPEQARGEEADQRSDVWAIGVVLYEMLCGEPPFKGTYPEAIAHAIKNDPPLRLCTPARDIPEALEQLVFRAIHKSPAVRFQSARELARALRQLQGRTMPVDLRTEPLPPVTAEPRRARSAEPGRVAAAAIAGAVFLIAAPLWILAPIERVPVAVAPVVNQTGYAELDEYRLALTHELIAQLAASPTVRVLPYDRLLQIVRGFRNEGSDVSSREALQAIAAHGGVRDILVPTLVYENGAWRGRVEFRDAESAIHAASVETAPVVSSLMKDTVYRLTASMTTAIEERFLQTASWRASLADRIRRIAGRAPPTIAPRTRSLDASAALARGLDAYEQLEYAAALDAFVEASQADGRNAVLWAWRSRAARLLRADDQATDAADQARRLLTADMSPDDRLFVEAIAAETRRELQLAESSYAQLADAHSDDAWARLELAGFFDRQGRTDNAIAGYRQALALDPRLARPHLELCRMYNRLAEFVTARDHAERALAAHRRTGARAGEAQALLCLADALRSGTPEQRATAARHAHAALETFEDLGLAYNVPRAYNYMAMIAGMERNTEQALGFGEQALSTARSAGNRVIQPLVLMNLGATSVYAGNRSRAAEYYRESYQLYEALGDQTRAAEIQANRAALVIAYGDDPADGLREAENALAVSRKLGNKDFETFGLQLVALHEQRAGRHTAAEREFNRAIAIAQERNLTEKVGSLRNLLARSRMAIGDYRGARDLLEKALAGPNERQTAVEAAIQLARVQLRLGATDDARESLRRISTADAADTGMMPLLHLALGETEYEAGALTDARAHFEKAAASAGDELPDPSALEAQAYLGLVMALEGRVAAGRRLVEATLDRSSQRLHLGALARVFLARIDVGQRRLDAALNTLQQIPADDAERTIGPKLRAEVQYWRSRAMAARGDAAAGAEAAAARN